VQLMFSVSFDFFIKFCSSSASTTHVDKATLDEVARLQTLLEDQIKKNDVRLYCLINILSFH